MSLDIDSLFITAISRDTDLMERIGDRVYSTAIPLPDEDAENVPVPYIIVTFDGMNNDETTKDDPFESDCDVVNIGVEVTAETRPALAELMNTVRETIHSYMNTNAATADDFPIEDYTLTADGVMYDQFKPCYWQTLRYSCDVINNDFTDDEDEQN